MKVLNLQCSSDHAFEGWFGSEDEFRDQLGRGLVSCPLCGDSQVAKMPSAPRLNLAGSRGTGERETSKPEESQGAHDRPATDTAPAAPDMERMKAAWWRAARKAVMSAEDVGPRFAEEALRIHHGEAEDRGIRGQASGEQVRQLLEEGVGVMPVPAALKETLQ